MYKEPVTADMLRAMVDLVGQEPSLSDVRLLVVCLVAFAGFMHCDELLKLQCSDIAFGTESMTINITSSKTDQYREGSSLVVARTGTPTCPVAIMGRYFGMGSLCTCKRGCVSVPDAKLAALRAMLQITGVATHLNAGFIILPLTIEVREKVERNDYLASAVLMKANIPQNIQYDVN